MLTVGEKALIHDLLRAQINPKEIARRTGRSLSTIYNCKRQLEDKPDPEITYSSTTRPINKKAYKPAVRVETAAGEQAQVDWGSFGFVRIDGKKEPLYAFILTLSYSRMMYVEFVIRQNLQTLLACHMNAFEALGIPKTIRYDNMKTVVLSHRRRRDEPPRIVYNPAFIDFARYYDFVPEACPPYWPRAKGKVERNVRFIRDSFIPTAAIGQQFVSLDHLNSQARDWLEQASERLHRGINERPIDRYKREHNHLMHTQNLPRYTAATLGTRMATKDGLVAYKGNLYSVPQYIARKKVAVREVSEQGIAKLYIYFHDSLIAEHRVSSGRGEWIVLADHSSDMGKTETTVIKSRKQPRNIHRHDIKVATRSLHYYD